MSQESPVHDQSAQRRRVRIVPGGPMMVEGPVEIAMPDGSVVQSDRFMVAVCMCRRSKNYPLCDTSHRRTHRPAVRHTPGDSDT